MTEMVRTRGPAGDSGAADADDTGRADRHRQSVRQAVRRYRARREAEGYKHLQVYVPRHLFERAKQAVQDIINEE